MPTDLTPHYITPGFQLIEEYRELRNGSNSSKTLLHFVNVCFHKSTMFALDVYILYTIFHMLKRYLYTDLLFNIMKVFKNKDCFI